MKAIVSATVKATPQFYDLDPMNIVWHGHYPRFMELGRVAVMEKVGYSYAEMVASGFAWPIVDLQLRYARPLRFGQSLLIEAGIVEWENRLKVIYDFRDEATGKRCTRGHTVQVAVDVRTEEMLWETPPILREKLSPFLS